MPRGALLVVEGVDRSGKSTQTAQLVAALSSRGRRAELRRFPERATATGKLLDADLRSKEATLDARTAHLLFAANRAEAMRSLRQALSEGTTVVIDRYAFSGVAYTLAKNEPGLDKHWCKSVDAGILKPDKVFFLDIPTKDASERADYGNERYEKIEFQEKVRECFLGLVDKSYWEIIDARQTKDEIADQMLQSAITAIDENSDKELMPLWK
ncbi:hypothetical protein HDU98_012196 [Podochytrium sp. JEL0797]|nr:hypothetical protein HDU98_012196 [Podochytrium sp. JEL0797]